MPGKVSQIFFGNYTTTTTILDKKKLGNSEIGKIV